MDSTEQRAGAPTAAGAGGGGAADGEARVRAEEARLDAERSLRLLAAAGQLLGDVTDLDRTLADVVRLAVPDLADWTLVDLIEPDGSLHRTGGGHADPVREALLHRLCARYPPRWETPNPVVRVLGGADAEIVPEFPEELLRRIADDEEHLRLLLALRPNTAINAPLRVRGRVIGSLSFVRAPGRPPFVAAELELAVEVARRAAISIDNARLFEAVRVADRRKDEFLATLAHELRNPLAPLRNAAHLLELDGGNQRNVQAARETILRQVEHMARLVDDLLDVGRITRGKLELRREPIEAAAIVRQAVEAVGPLAAAAGVALEVELPPAPVCLDADPVRLVQVLQNLLHNACKYTARGGSVRIAARRDGGEVEIAVRDTGIGLAPEALTHVFDMFSQAAGVEAALAAAREGTPERVPRTDRTQGGLGIGLALSRALVEMHGGRISAASAGLGRGSEFVVRLPLASEDAGEARAAAAPSPAVPPAGAAKALRLVVADDNADNTESLATLLRVLGHEVATAHDGLAAVEQIAAVRPHLAFVDLGMPEIDGLEVARRVRAEPWGAEVVLVAQTGWGGAEYERLTREAGFDRHLVKPLRLVTVQALLAAIDARRR